MDHVRIGEAEVALPDMRQWCEAIAAGELAGLRLVSPGAASSWLDRHGQLPCAVLGAWRHRDRWWAIPLLRLGDGHYPVHFEDVVCQHCGQRCGLSASPDTTSLAWPGSTAADAWALFSGLPVLPCPHCGRALEHRQTIWLAEAGIPFRSDDAVIDPP